MKRHQEKFAVPGKGHFVFGKNVRRNPADPAQWQSAPLPAMVRSDGWLPFGLTQLRRPAQGMVVLWFCKGNILGYALYQAGQQVDLSEAEVTGLGPLPGELLKVVATDGMLRFLLRDVRAVYATYNSAGAITLQGKMPRWPQLRFERTAVRTASVPIGVAALTGKTNPQGHALDSADQPIVDTAVDKAYLRMKRAAIAAGMFLQPVLVRYRLEDGNGDTLFTSVPVVVSSAGGLQCTGEYNWQSTDSMATLTGGSLSGTIFSVALKGMAQVVEPWSRMVRKAVVEVADVIDPIRPQGGCSASMANDGRNTTLTLTLNRKTPDELRRGIVAALTDAAAYFKPHLVVDYPFAKGCAAMVALAPEPMEGNLFVGLQASRSAVPSNPERDATGYGAITDLMQITVAIGETTEGFAGHGAGAYAISSGEGSWNALMQAQPGDDLSALPLTAADSGIAGAPNALSPLLIFPDSDATQITVAISSGGEIRQETYPLTPLAEAGCAFWLADDFRPIYPRGVVSTMPAREAGRARCVVNADVVRLYADREMTWPTDTLGGGSNVCLVADMPRNSGSWDFSRQRLLLFGGDGIKQLTLNASGQVHAMAPMDGRGVADAWAVCRGSSSKGLCYYAATMGGDIVCVDRTGVSTVAAGYPNVVAAGWCGRFNELWLADGEGSRTLRLNLARPLEVVEVGGDSLKGAARPMMWQGRLLLVDGASRLLDPARDADDEAVDMQLTLRYRWPAGASAPQWPSEPASAGGILIPAVAEKFAGNITIGSDGGTEIPDTICRLAVSGAINAPIPVMVLMPSRRFVTLSFEGNVRKFGLVRNYSE